MRAGVINRQSRPSVGSIVADPRWLVNMPTPNSPAVATDPTATDAKRALLRAAREMFLQHGYTRTAVNAVIDRAGLSKGTFYYHFESKADLLRVVVEELTDGAWPAIAQAVESAGPDPIEQVNALFAASWHWREANIESLARVGVALYRDENVLLREKVRARTHERAVPLLADVLFRGSAQGAFDVSDATETARLVLLLATAVTDTNMLAFVESADPRSEAGAVLRRVDVLLRSVERMIRAPQGALRGPGERFVTRVAEALAAMRSEAP